MRRCIRTPSISVVCCCFLPARFSSPRSWPATLNSRLRRREQEIVDLGDRLQRAYGRLQTLYEGMQAVNSTLDLQQVLDRLARGTAEAMGVRGCSIRLLDESGARLTLAAAYGLSDGYVRKGDLTLERNPLAREVLVGKVISVGDVTREDRLQFGSRAAEEGLRSTLSARLQGKRGTLGMIRAYSTEFNHFTQDDITFLTAIANQGSLAIENAMAFQTLGQLDEMKSKFVLIITHELRSPVSVVRSLFADHHERICRDALRSANGHRRACFAARRLFADLD